MLVARRPTLQRHERLSAPDVVQRLSAIAAGVGQGAAIVHSKADRSISSIAAAGLDDFGRPESSEPASAWSPPSTPTPASTSFTASCAPRRPAPPVRPAHRVRRPPARPPSPPRPCPPGLPSPDRPLRRRPAAGHLHPRPEPPRFLAYEIAHPVVADDVNDDTPASWAECGFRPLRQRRPASGPCTSAGVRLPEECLSLMAPRFDISFWSTTSTCRWVGSPAVIDYVPASTTSTSASCSFSRRHAQAVAVQVAGALAPSARSWPSSRTPHHGHAHEPVEAVAWTMSTLAQRRYTRFDEVDAHAVAAWSVFGLRDRPEWWRRCRIHEGQVAELPVPGSSGRPDPSRRTRPATLGLPNGARAAGLMTGLLAARPKGRLGATTSAPRDYGLDEATCTPTCCRRLPGPLQDLIFSGHGPVARPGGAPNDAAVAREGALDEPGAAAAGQARASTDDVGERSPPLGQSGLDHQGRGLEVVAVVADGAAEVVPGRVDGRRWRSGSAG